MATRSPNEIWSNAKGGHWAALYRPMMLRTTAFVAALTIAAPAAAAPCSIGAISGVWSVHVERVSWDVQGGFGPDRDSNNCWFAISRNNANTGNIRIDCPGYFSLDQRDFDFKPWHQLARASRSGSQMVAGRRFATPNRCEWTLLDRNGLDAEYTIRFSPDGQTLMGYGEGFHDLHFGSTEPFEVTINGVRQ